MSQIGVLALTCLSLTLPVSAASRLLLEPNKVRVVPLQPNSVVELYASVRRSNFSSLVLHANALNPICLSTAGSRGRCPSSDAFYGANVGLEQVVPETRPPEFSWILRSNSKQKVFVVLRAYRGAPIIGACSVKQTDDTDMYNPNLALNRANDAVDILSFNFSSIFDSYPGRHVLRCSDKGLKSVITYELYALPWNQRYRQPKPSFNASSLRSLVTVLNVSSSPDLLGKGVLLTSLQMSSPNALPEIRISRRLGLDVVLAVAARLESEDARDAFYVAYNVWGCAGETNQSCVFLSSLLTKILVGIFACFGLLFSHLGRRIHRLNTFISGYVLGFLISYPLLRRFTNLDPDADLAVSLAACSVAIALLTMGSCWRAKRNARRSYMPLYIDVSFLIVAALFFTSIGNQTIWQNEAVFAGVFFGIVAFLAVLIFPWVTELISVDLCTPLLGCFIFVAGASAIFLPGCVFPYVLLDAVNRIAVPHNHGALSVYVNSAVDLLVFVAWPLLALLVAVINHYCSPPLAPPQQVPVQNDANAYEGPDGGERSWRTIESWPPLPPDAFVSERAPLLNDRRPTRPEASAPLPPPYSAPGEAPPAYKP